MSIWFAVLVVAPLYVWAHLHIRKSVTTWSRFDTIENDIKQIRRRVSSMEAKLIKKRPRGK